VRNTSFYNYIKDNDSKIVVFLIMIEIIMIFKQMEMRKKKYDGLSDVFNMEYIV